MKERASFGKKQGSLIALACAAAFAVPQAAVASVDEPDFSSGKGLSLSVDFTIGLASKIGTGATAGQASNTSQRWEVFSSSSSVYIKGSEKVGGSIIRGWGFIITWDFDPDEYNRRGANEVATTVIGLDTPGGAFFLGVMDSPYKQIGSSFVAVGSTWGNGLSQSGNLGTPGFRTGTAKGSRNGSAAGGGANTTTTMSFYRLNSNSVNWYSPTFAGFKLYAQWVPGDSDVPAGIVDIHQENWSAGVTFDAGPFSIGYVYEQRKDYLWGSVLTENFFGRGSAAAGSGGHSKDKGQVLGAAFTFGNFRFGGYYQRLEYRQGSGGALNLTELDVDSWYLGARWRGGPWEIGGFYFNGSEYDCNGTGTVASNILVGQCGSDTGVQAYGIGMRYRVTKQLRFFASASRYDNEDRALYSGHSSAPTVGVGLLQNPAGMKFTNFSVGITGSY